MVAGVTPDMVTPLLPPEVQAKVAILAVYLRKPPEYIVKWLTENYATLAEWNKELEFMISYFGKS
jgi:hypothetical protein